MSKLIYVDYDSVLNNLSYSWINWINKKYNTNHNISDVDNWYWFQNKFGKEVYEYFKVVYSLDNEHATIPYKGSREFLKNTEMLYPTKILTSTHQSEELINVKNKHINYYYDFDSSKVIHEHQKYKYATPNAVLVDDRDWNVINWVLSGGIAILYNHNDEYNHNETMIEHQRIFKASNYGQVLNIIKSL